MTADTLDETVKDAIEELEEWMREHYPDDPSDELHEIADTAVPVYTADTLRFALENLSLATAVPELGPAGDGEASAINIINANIYEYIEGMLAERASEYKDELDELVDELNDLEEEIDAILGKLEDAGEDTAAPRKVLESYKKYGEWDLSNEDIQEELQGLLEDLEAEEAKKEDVDGEQDKAS